MRVDLPAAPTAVLLPPSPPPGAGRLLVMEDEEAVRTAVGALAKPYGVPELQEQLGHSSIQITMDIYGHLFEGSHRRYADALDSVLETTSCNARATESETPARPALVSAS